MTTSKEEERKALKKIRTIVEGLGENSYIAAAFEGCFQDALNNIEWDSAMSMKNRYEMAQKTLDELDDKHVAETAELNRRIHDLELQVKELNGWLNWQPYEDEHNVKQADYDELKNGGGTRELSDDEAKELISDEFGFDITRIEIIREIKEEEITDNLKARRIRKTGNTIERKPLYNATDWNYVRFNVTNHYCATHYYEMLNGELRPFYD